MGEPALIAIQACTLHGPLRARLVNLADAEPQSAQKAFA